MKIPIKLTVLGLLGAMILCGCSSMSLAPVRSDLQSIRKKYDTQRYSECINQIDRFLNRYTARSGGWALLVMTKAMCHEEMGNIPGADALYRQVIDFVPNTQFADLAKQRLNRVAGDQKEHLQLDVIPEHFCRVKNNWSSSAMQSWFALEGQGIKTARSFILITSMDRLPEVKTLDDVVQRMRASAGLNGKSVEIIPIGILGDDGLWSVKDSGSRKEGATVGFARVVLTRDRMHILTLAKKGTEMTGQEKERWVAMLKSAKLVTSR